MSSPESIVLADSLEINASGVSQAIDIAGSRCAARLNVELTDVQGEVSVRFETSQSGTLYKVVSPEINESCSISIGGVERLLQAAWTVSEGGSARLTITGESHQCYATLADLVRYGLPEHALQDVPITERVEQLLAASSIADGPLYAAGFVLPLISWGDDLREAVASIAAANCLVQRGFSPEGSDQTIVDRGERRRRWLDGIGDGGRISPLTRGTPPQVVPASAVVVSRRRRGSFL